MLLYIYTQCIYIYMILCIVDVCNGQVGWYIQFLDGTYMQCIYIYILMYNICVRYIYIHITYYRYIIIDCTKMWGLIYCRLKKHPKKRCRKVWNQDGSPMICSHIFPAVLFVVSMTGGCFILYEISDWVSYDYQCLGHFLTLWNHD